MNIVQQQTLPDSSKDLQSVPRDHFIMNIRLMFKSGNKANYRQAYCHSKPLKNVAPINAQQRFVLLKHSMSKLPF